MAEHMGPSTSKKDPTMREAKLTSFEVRPIENGSFIVGENVTFIEDSERLLAVNEDGSPFGVATKSASEKIKSLESDDSHAMVESSRDGVPWIAIYRRVESEIANALTPSKTHLESFKLKAKRVTVILLIVGALMTIWGVTAHSNALTEYSDNLREYPSIASDLYYDDANEANIILFSGIALTGCAGIPCFFWIASNLLVAFHEDNKENRPGI